MKVTFLNTDNVWIIIVLIGISFLIVLFKYIHKEFVQSTIKWYDQSSFDNSIIHFGFTIASVYDNGIRIDAYKDISEADIAVSKGILQSAWKVANKEELLNAMENLRTDTHRSAHDRLSTYVKSLKGEEFKAYLIEIEDDSERVKAQLLCNHKYTSLSFFAGDLLRFFFIAHLGVLANYITINEFGKYCAPIIILLQKKYAGWKDFFTHFLLGRSVWKTTPYSVSIKALEYRIKDLLNNSISPCKKVSWDYAVNVSNEYETLLMEENTFWELIEATNKTGLSTFLLLLERELDQLTSEELFSFKATLEVIIETFSNPMYHYGASLIIPKEISPYALLVWLLFRGKRIYKEFIVSPDKLLTKELKATRNLYQKEDSFFFALEENLRLLSIADIIIKKRSLNPIFKTLTYEQRSDVYEASCKFMPLTDNPYPNLLKALTLWT